MSSNQSIKSPLTVWSSEACRQKIEETPADGYDRMWFDLQMWLRKRYLEFCRTGDDNVWRSAEACYEAFEIEWYKVFPSSWVDSFGEPKDAEF